MRGSAVVCFGLAFIASGTAAHASSFTVTATDIAPSAILESQIAGILRVAVANPAAGGAPTLRLSRFGLRLEGPAGAGLATLAASDLFSSIEVYLDANASGAFEPAFDKFVNALFSPDVAADGTLGIEMAAAEPADLEVSSANTANYFIVVRLSPNASAANPSTFRITHMGGGGATSAVDAGNGAPLTLTTALNVASKIVTATVNHPPTTSGLANVTAFDNAAQGVVLLHPAFQDAEDASNLLTYTITSNTNPSLFGFVGIEAAAGRLLCTYVPGVTGVAQLTIRAADTLGKSVTASLLVKVNPFITYTDFMAVYPGAGGPLERSLPNGQTNLLSYAFFLNQGLNGGTAGLPRLQGIGNARIFSHLRPKSASDVFFNYQLSQDLQAWVPAVKNVDYYENTRDMGDGSVSVELLLLNQWQKAFMRVQTQLVGSPAPPPPNDPQPPGGGEPPLPQPPPPGTGVPIVSSAVYPSQFVIGNSQTYASDVAVIDMDNDGFKDVVAASQRDNKVAWYHNNQDGTFGAAQIITTSAAGVIAVAAADLDNDGLVDVASASQNDNKIAWYKRNANGSFGPQQVLNLAAQFPTALETVDLDNDGKRDVIYASWFGGHISWCKNLGNGAFASAQIVTNQSVAPYGVTAADLDGDGVKDIVTGSTSSDSVDWYKGTGDGTVGVRRRLTVAGDAAFDAPVSFSSGDLDGDGLLDIVASDAATNKIAWFRNLGGANFAARQIISNQGIANYAVLVSDINGDGLLDVLSASQGNSKVAWYRNWGGGNFGDPDANQLIITETAAGVYSVATGDFNQDGKLDVASASQDDSKVAVYFNRGGQSGLSTTDIAPAVMLDGQQRAILRIEVGNRGIPGNDNARLDTVSLLLDSSAGVPLTTAQANALIESLRIYADINDSGAFESNVDVPVAMIPHLVLNAGKLTVPVQGNALAIQIAPGTSRSFFVVPRLTVNAGAQNPAAFRLTHFTQGIGLSTARDAFTGALLTVEASPVSSVTSSVTTATTNSSPTTVGLPSIVVNDTVLPSAVSLKSYFGDLEDGPDSLRYEVTGNTNAGLFSFAGIDANAKLILRYRPGISGNATITVKATDTAGKSVTSSLSASVVLANTFNAWVGGGAGATQQTLLRYAFGLSPLGGGVAGLPRMKIQGKSRVITHLKPTWATDLNYQYEISQDLLSWVPATPGTHYHEFSKNLPNAIRQTDLVLLVNWPKAYLRARAVLAN